MSHNNSSGFQNSGTDQSQNRQRIMIPALLTNSLRVVVDVFGKSIYQLTAHGSSKTTNRSTIEELRKYGVNIEQRSSHAVTIDYERFTEDEGEPLNALTEQVSQQLLSEVETQLNSEDLSVAPDLAVTSVTVRTTSEQLAEVTPAQTAEFDLRFVADPAEEAVRDRTKLVNRGRGLTDELGFDCTNLNLRSVVETATKYNEQSNGQYLHWHGPDDVRPRAPELLATRVNEHVLPDEYGMLKPYAVTDDHVLEIDEDAIELGNVPDQSATTEGE